MCFVSVVSILVTCVLLPREMCFVSVVSILVTCVLLLRSPLGFTIWGEIFAYVTGFFF